MSSRQGDAPRRPPPWRDVRRGVSWYALPAYAISWAAATFAHELHHSPFLALAKLGATFALPVAAITYCAESKDRHRDRVYRTWEIVANAQGTGNGARYEALQDLVENDVSLAHAPLSTAWLEQADLRGADLRHARLDRAYAAGVDLGCRYELLYLLRHFNPRCTRLRMSTAYGADLAGANLRGADLELLQVDSVDFSGADLRDANLRSLRGWQRVTGWRDADLRQARNAPPGLLDTAACRGARTDVQCPGR